MLLCLSKIFTPAVCTRLKTSAKNFNARRLRWFLKPLCFVGLFTALAQGRTLGARFNEARQLAINLFPKKVRPGAYLSGFQAALRALPQAVMAELRRACQDAVRAAGLEPARVGRHLCFGVDGTQQDAPRTTANEQHFGVSTKEPLAPQRKISTCFCLFQRMLWDWCGGPGNGSEPAQILEMILRGPQGALYVKDAGKVSYDWFRAVLASRHHLLMRVGGNFSLWAAEAGAVLVEGGRVLVWPEGKRATCPPIALRLIAYPRTYIKIKHGQRQERTEMVYLLTDLLASALTEAEAQQLFALRWPANEIGHRGWKRTLGKHKLASARPQNADKESEFSLLACMMLQALALLAQGRRAKAIPSMAQALDVWSVAVKAVLQGRSASWLCARLKKCVLDKYKRHSAKVKRAYPRRKEHRPLKPPIVLQLDAKTKDKLAMTLNSLGILVA
jgi:hypothetical protein